MLFAWSGRKDREGERKEMYILSRVVKLIYIWSIFPQISALPKYVLFSGGLSVASRFDAVNDCKGGVSDGSHWIFLKSSKEDDKKWISSLYWGEAGHRHLGILACH